MKPGRPPKRIRNCMLTWFYRILLFWLLFGIGALFWGGNQIHPLLSISTNLAGLVAASLPLLFLFRYPPSYKVLAWLIGLGVVGLVLESLYLYGQYMYSFFVVKRFAYPGLALLTYYVASKSALDKLKLSYAVNLIFVFFVWDQFVLGRMYTYALTNESRTTSAYESFYMLLPFAYFLVQYVREGKRLDLLKALATFGLIVFLLHRSVISTAVMAGLLVLFLSSIGRVAGSRLKIGKTVSTLLMLGVLGLPLLSLINPAKLAGFTETMAGIVAPEKDETGSWRLEQSQYYMKQFAERPLLGWRYEGYDRGEIMANEDFPDKGTIIHSQYVDMLYNYGALGLAFNLLVVFSTLLYMYLRNPVFTLEQTVLFVFIVGGLLFGFSYQVPVFYWSFIGLGMYYGQVGLPRVRRVNPYADVPDHLVPYEVQIQPTNQSHD